MSEEYKSILRGLKQALDDAKGNNGLPRKTVDSNEQINREYKRLDLSKLEFGNVISSQEALKDIVPFNWDLPDEERNKE